MTKTIRWTGWTLISVGALILLYLVYLLFFTTFQADAAQDDLLEQWELEVGAVEDARRLPGEDPEDAEARTAEGGSVDPGDAYAAMWFERGDDRVVHEDTLFVVEGVSLDHLRQGPGHYPETEGPGSAGNFAVSGHRTTYGAPFYNLNELEPGDEVHVVDRGGTEFVYEVVESQIVEPDDVWVLEDDPLGTGTPTLTLTTCHPRFSASQRLIVFAELQSA